MSFPAAYRERVLQTIGAIDLDAVARAIEWLREARQSGRTVFVAGNGGSAATASHFVCDLVKDASYGRTSRFRALNLTDSIPTVSAYSNDVSYFDAVAEQLKNFAQAGDIYMALSGSGNSPNVVRAMEYANSVACRTIALTGRDGGKLGPLAGLHIRVPEEHMGRIQDAHHVICHIICYSFMEQG
jgi:D-sedoheptulose 7-phosphate isomerase